LAPACLPMRVWPLPSSPWHLAQFLVQFSLASAARTATPVASNTAAMNSVLFIIRVIVCRLSMGWSLAPGSGFSKAKFHPGINHVGGVVVMPAGGDVVV